MPAGQDSPWWGVGGGFLKRFTALCYIRYLAFASHLLLLAIRASKRNKEVGRVDRAKRGWSQKRNEVKNGPTLTEGVGGMQADRFR